MVIILSEDFDVSTCDVIDWLNFNKKDFFRINSSDKIKLIFLDYDSFKFECKGKIISSEDITALWYRRGNFSSHLINGISSNSFIEESFKKFIDEEYRCVFAILHKRLSNKKGVSSIFNASLNKLSVLEFAKEVGLTVPDTLITTQKKLLQNFYNIKGSIITKPLASTISIETKEAYLAAYTEQVSQHTINSLSETFELSLFQEQITKKYELRIFYLNGEFYAMAIFSQLDNQTKTDFRKYNKVKPNRTVPYSLDQSLKEKLKLLMDKFKLNSGSIDIVVSTDNKFYFLEVNPVGQFGMTSYPCNYNLENKIAEALC
jgi:ATP-GRASP peptide maturase of grasp-with-spasm system